MSKSANKIVFLFATMMIFGFIDTSAAESWYTKEQASAGHLLFNNYCAECHRPDLTGAMGPALLGPVFKKRWAGKTIEEFYKFEHRSMPPLEPGSLTANELFPITAYILKRNGFPAGSTALSETSAARLRLPK